MQQCLKASPLGNEASTGVAVVGFVFAKDLQIILGKGINVPRTLQNTHYDGEDAKVKGQNYKYPHNYSHHWVKQQYLPDDIKDSKYFIYQDNKFEQTLKEYWDKVKK